VHLSEGLTFQLINVHGSGNKHIYAQLMYVIQLYFKYFHQDQNGLIHPHSSLAAVIFSIFPNIQIPTWILTGFLSDIFVSWVVFPTLNNEQWLAKAHNAHCMLYLLPHKFIFTTINSLCSLLWHFKHQTRISKLSLWNVCGVL